MRRRTRYFNWLYQESCHGSERQSSSRNGQEAAPAKPAEQQAEPALTDQKAKASYALGMGQGMNLRRQGVEMKELDAEAFAHGLQDAMEGKKPLLTENEMQAAVNQLQVDVQTHMKEMAENNKKEGDAFLAANKTKPGVVTLPSGLQYKIITTGTGPKPTAADTVSVNYRTYMVLKLRRMKSGSLEFFSRSDWSGASGVARGGSSCKDTVATFRAGRTTTIGRGWVKAESRSSD